MNTCIFQGRITATPELKHTPSNVPLCEITLAVDRKFTNADGNRETDFLRLVFWRKQAELIVEHMGKGSKVLVQSHVVTRSYETDNGTKYVTEFHVDEFDFIDSKKIEEDDEQMAYQTKRAIEEAGQPKKKKADESDLPF